MGILKFILGLLLTSGLFLVAQGQLPIEKVSVHDPVMIKQDSLFYLFSTGNGIKVQSSKDLIHWNNEKPVFKEAPQWALQSIPNFKGHIWAPDISFHNNLYYLYYSVSTFGKNSSAIGVATTPTLNPLAEDFKWTDHGMVIASVPGKDHWNAIDPNLVMDEKGKAWLTFGSFWDGIKQVPLENDLLSVEDDVLPTTIASKKKAGERGDNAIEAPFIFKKRKFYYLFASTDYCCKGENSTYKMIVGRSGKVTGPYVDQNGQPLANGGGTVLLAGNKNWHGVGHNAVYHTDSKDYLVFHGYDKNDGGKPKLRIYELKWKRNWPTVWK